MDARRVFYIFAVESSFSSIVTYHFCEFIEHPKCRDLLFVFFDESAAAVDIAVFEASDEFFTICEE